MLLNLLVAELEHLKAFWESSLCSLSIGKVVHHFLIGVGLLDVVVVEIHDGVSIREGLSSNSVAEDNFLLAIDICPLNLSVVTHYLVLHCCVSMVSGTVVFLWHFHFEIFVFIFLEFVKFTFLAISFLLLAIVLL